jgi:hypothetical protein
MATFSSDKHARNPKVQTEAFKKAIALGFDFENPDDIAPDDIEVSARFQHLKAMVSDADTWESCDVDELKEVFVNHLELLARHEKSTIFLNNAAIASGCSKQQALAAVKNHKWDETRRWQHLHKSAKTATELVASWTDTEENEAVGGHCDEDDMVSLDSCDDSSCSEAEEGEVTSPLNDDAVILLPLVAGIRVLQSTPQLDAVVDAVTETIALMRMLLMRMSPWTWRMHHHQKKKRLKRSIQSLRRRQNTHPTGTVLFLNVNR